jgi:hypothetical protein
MAIIGAAIIGMRIFSGPTGSLNARLLRQFVLLLILAIPSLYVFLTLPPLWRDEDAFNEIASTFAPRGIIHYLPGYCLGGRLIVFTGSTVGSLLSGHGIPHLSLDMTPLNDAGIYSLIVVQHLFLIFSLWYAVRTLSDNFPMRVLLAVSFALTPFLYIYANCLGSEAFSNPLVYLIAAYGWTCVKAAKLSSRKVLIYSGLLLAAVLTRQINAVLAAGLPIALLPLVVKEIILGLVRITAIDRQGRWRYTRRLLIFVLIGWSVIGTSLLAQQTMCWLFRVPFGSTFGETFEYRLHYLEGLPEQERTAIIAQISAKADDPVVQEALGALNRSLIHGEKWSDLFLYYKIDEILVRSGFQEVQSRTFQIHAKLNRIAACVLLSGELNFRNAVWIDFVLSPFFTQPDLAYPPFGLTDWVQIQLRYPRYERLRGLASFVHQEGYYEALWERFPYAHLFERIPILEMVCLTVGLAVALGGLSLVGVARDHPVPEAGVWYAIAMIVVGLLVSLGTCLSTYFQGRLYLPVYSLFQIGMLLVVSLAVNLLLGKLKDFRMSALEAYGPTGG